MFNNKHSISVNLTDKLLGVSPCSDKDKLKYSVIQYRCLPPGILH